MRFERLVPAGRHTIYYRVRDRGQDRSCFRVTAEIFFLLCVGMNGCLWQADTRRIVNTPSRTVLPAPLKVRLCNSPDELPLIEASVNGCGPHLYVLDTGTDSLVLSRRLLPEIRPQPLATTVTMETQSGPRFLGSEYRVKVVRIGCAEFHNLTGCSADLSNIESAIGRKLGGVLGMGVFADCRLTIDYPAGEVLLEPLATVLREGQNASVFPLELSPGGIPHIVLDIQGNRLRTRIDSGSQAAFTVPERLLPRLPATPSPVRLYASRATFHGMTPIYATRLRGSVFLGDHEFVRPIIEVLDCQPLLGHEALRHFRISIDLKRKQALFTRTGCGPIGPPPSVRHHGFSYRQMVDRLLVTGSVEGVTLEELGLREGDEVVAVNGTQVSELSPGALRKLVKTHDTLTLEIVRENVKISVNVPVTVLIP